jgi:hypothetical protein
MPLEIIDCDQNSPTWFDSRKGLVTASQFKTVLASGKGGGESITRRKYLYTLAGEIITGEPSESFSNRNMERGHEMEGEARNFYAFMKDIEPERVGFIRNGRKGASPDSLLGTDGLLEIKTAIPSVLIELLIKDQFPPEHKAQTQGQLMVAEREWVDICCYWPGMPPLIKRAARDEKYISELSRAVSIFNEELDALVSRIRSYGGHDAIGEEAAA